jgi:hypothetical protein
MSKNMIFDTLLGDPLYEISKFVSLSPLWITCRTFWKSNVRKTMVYLSLKDNDVAMRFYRDDAFRIYVYSRVQNPSRQIFLKLINCSEVTDVSALGNVHTLDLSGCSRVTDVSALGNVHTLNLRGCRKVTDVSALGKVHTLNLHWCYGVTDVSALGNVKYLKI